MGAAWGPNGIRTQRKRPSYVVIPNARLARSLHRTLWNPALRSMVLRQRAPTQLSNTSR